MLLGLDRALSRDFFGFYEGLGVRGLGLQALRVVGFGLVYALELGGRSGRSWLVWGMSFPVV